jgi:hypothetical protein
MSDENETPVVPEGTENIVEDSETSTTESDVTEEVTETAETSDNSEEEAESSKEDEKEAEESDTSEEEAMSSNKAKKRFGKMTMKLRTLESENERLRAAQEQSTSKPADEPKEEDYADYTEYEDAKLDWKLDQREAKRAETDKQNSAVNQANERQEEFHKKADIVRESKEDFDEVAMSPDMLDFYANDARHVAEIIEGHDRGPEIAYYLGSNPEIAVDLAKMSNLQAAVTIGEIGLKLSMKPKPKAVSKAGKPITPIGGGGGSDAESDKDDPHGDNLSTKEWFAREEAKRRA